MSDKAFNWLASILFVVIAILFTITSVAIFNVEPSDEVIEQEKQRLYELEKSVGEDAESLIALDRASIELVDNQIRVSFYGESCRFEAVYDKEMNVIEKNFIDLREKATPLLIVFIVIVGLMFSAFASMILSVTICTIVEAIQKRRTRKKRPYDNIS